MTQFTCSPLTCTLRSKFPVYAVKKRAVCENLSVPEAETHQHKDEVERGSTLPVLHVPPFRQSGTNRRHRGLKGGHIIKEVPPLQ